MIAFRDILIFAGLAALAAAVIASLFPVGEGASPVPACSDCVFKLTGGYWIRQYGNYAALYLGTREAARYGWAYVDGRPLGVGEAAGCDPMYVHVLNGIAYVSCNGNNNPTLGRRVLPMAAEGVDISANSWGPGCSYTVNAALNASATVRVEVYNENGRLVYSASSTTPATFTFNVPVAGTYRMRVYAPPFLDKWYTLHAGVNVTGTNIAVGGLDFLNDMWYSPRFSLKIADLTDYWKAGWLFAYLLIGYDSFGGRYITISRPSSAFFADFLLAWEDCCSGTWYIFPYRDEVWRLTFTPSGPVLSRIRSAETCDYDDEYDEWICYGIWHEVYADGRLIWTFNKPGPKNDVYVGTDPTITVRFVTEESTMNAEATFTKICRWS